MVDLEKRRDAAGPASGKAIESVLETVTGAVYRIDPSVPQPHVIVFTASGCRPCEQARQIIGKLSALNGDVRTVIVHRGDSQATHVFTKNFPPQVVAVSDQAGEVLREWRVPGTPFLVSTDATAIVTQKGTPSATEEGIQKFFDSARSISNGG